MSASSCPLFDGCNVPLCPIDESSLERGSWFPDEEACHRRDLTKLLGTGWRVIPTHLIVWSEGGVILRQARRLELSYEHFKNIAAYGESQKVDKLLRKRFTNMVLGKVIRRDVQWLRKS